MPQMANITVKKADGTTDILWTAMAPAAGDKSSAIWRSNTVGASVAQRPELRMQSQGNSQGTQRVIKTNFVYPILATENGVVMIKGYVTQVTESKITLTAPDADAKEAVYQGFNLLSSALVKDAVQAGFAPQ